MLDRAAPSALLLSLALFTGHAAAQSAGVTLTPVAVSGQAAPGTGGKAFQAFEVPSINDAGLVAFNALLPRPEGAALQPAGVFSGVAGALHAHALTGDTSPAPNAPAYGFFSAPVTINNAGDVLFGATFSPEANGLFVARRAGSGGTPAPPAVVGATQVEAESKRYLGVVELFPPRLGHGGHGAFTAMRTGKVTEDQDDAGVWVARPDGQLRVVTLAGDRAPGTENVFARSSHFSAPAFHQPAVDRNGDVAFVAHLRGDGVTEQNESGLWYTDGTSEEGWYNLKLAARKGDYVMKETYITYSGFDLKPSLADGRLAFRADLYGPPPPTKEDAAPAVARTGPVVQSDSEPYQAIMAGPPDALKIVMHTRTHAPNAGYSFVGLGAPALNAAGQMAFTARMRYWEDTDPDGSGRSLWGYGPGVGPSASDGLRLLAQDGTAAPGTPEGVVFKNFQDPSVNDAGQFALLADLKGPGVTETNDTGIWLGDLEDASDSIHLIAREGQVIDLGDGLPRTISGLSMLTGGNGGEDGGPSAFNDAGQLAFVARFTDGTSAVLVGAVPEPSTAGMVMGMALATLLRRRRRW